MGRGLSRKAPLRWYLCKNLNSHSNIRGDNIKCNGLRKPQSGMFQEQKGHSYIGSK